MLRDTGRQRLRPYRIMWRGFALICLFLFSSCGTTEPDRPLVTGTDTPTTQGSPTLTANPSAQVLPIKVVQAQTHLSAYPGGNMTLTISTSPYAVCSFVVSYGLDTPSNDLGIIPRTADDKGMASWTWRVENAAHTGTWPLALSATLASGAKTAATINVYVVLPGISLVSSQSKLSAPPGGDITLTIATAPSMNSSVVVNYGPGVPGKTFTRRSDVNGIASWTWRVDTAASPGVYASTVSVTIPDGESSSIRVNITVT